MVWVKICGLTNLEDARSAEELGADALGFIFAESPRRVSAETALSITDNLNGSILKAGVFVNEDIDKIGQIAEKCHLDIVQLHGDEGPEYCSKISPLKVIKAFGLKDLKDIDRLKDYKVDYYLLDTYLEDKHGGTGKTFDWELAKKAKEMVSPIILSGGLNPDNISDALKSVEPFGVDASSGLEKSPGMKDHKLLKRFIENVKTFV